MISIRNMAGVAVASIALSACGDLPETPLVQPGTQTGQVVFTNPTPRPVILLQFNPCNQRIMGSPDFGPDRLNGRIAPGASRQFTVSAGCYNLRAMTGGGGFFSNNIENFQNFTVVPGGTTTVSIWRP